MQREMYTLLCSLTFISRFVIFRSEETKVERTDRHDRIRKDSNTENC